MSKKFLYKLILLGDGAVGKTSLRERYTTGSFGQRYSRTIGADFAVKRIQVNDTEMVLQIWDIAGQTGGRFAYLSTTYFQGASGAILVFDVSRPETLENIKHWIEKLWESVGHIPMVIFGNKIDLRKDLPCISTEEGHEFAREIAEMSGAEVQYFETSAKTGENVNKAFYFIGENMHHYKQSKNR